jgi:hypothetical protein
MNRAILGKLLFTMLYSALAATLSLSALPAFADQPIDTIDWDSLPKETQEALAPVAGRWHKIKPNQQHKLVRRAEEEGFKNRAERWKKLSPKQRERIVKARQRFKDMPPEKRKKLRERWENMSDQEKRKFKDKPLEKRPLKDKRDHKEKAPDKKGKEKEKRAKPKKDKEHK